MPERLRIFISYRRDDSVVDTMLICSELVRRFGEDHVFMDIEDIRYGDDFKQTIDEKVRGCNVLIAVIGPQWAGLLERRPPRTDDYVRYEIASALARGTRVIPVLVGRATAAALHAAPEDLAALKTINALLFDQRDLKLSINALVEAVQGRSFEEVRSLARRRLAARLPLRAGVHALWEACKKLVMAAPATAELPAPVTDRVHFTATAPPSVAPGTDFLLQVWGHLEDQRREVLRRARRLAKGRRIGEKGPLALPRGTVLRVCLNPIEGLDAREPEDIIYWHGEIGNATFRVSVAATAPPGPRLGTITFYVANLAVGTLHFTLTVGSEAARSDHLPSQFKRYRTAFASYASDNRDDVLRIIQGLQKGMPDLRVFLDVTTLRSGARWADEIQRVIPMQDVFYLFWSLAASRSSWVEGEWRCALKTRGLAFIDVAPLEAPEVAPPPEELRSLHFGDWTLAYRRHFSPGPRPGSAEPHA